MQDWKQAFWLAKFEIKALLNGFIGLFLFSLVMALYFASSINDYLEKNFVGFDLFFILIFTLGMVWTKPKDFQNRKINADIIASPSLIMLNQLAIKQSVLIKSRFVVHFIYSFPYQVFLLIIMYSVAPEMKDIMTIPTYIVFSIIWLSFGVYAGYVFPASDAGDKTNTTATVVYVLLFCAAAIGIFTSIHLISQHGIIQWTIIFAQKWPILSTILSILLAILGFNYWQRYMKKTMDKLDYL